MTHCRQHTAPWEHTTQQLPAVLSSRSRRCRCCSRAAVAASCCCCSRCSRRCSRRRLRGPQAAIREPKDLVTGPVPGQPVQGFEGVGDGGFEVPEC